jgi:ubiquitin-conjugating enzyme E2 variant
METVTGDPRPFEQPLALTVVKATALVAAVSVLAVFSVGLAGPMLTPSAWPWLATGLLFGYLLADFLSGTVHWFCDSFFAPDTPLIGRTVIYPFRDHHDHPEAITQYRFLEQDSTSYVITIPPLLLALSTGGPDVTRPTVVFLHGLLFAFAVGALGTNVFHKWAHASSVPPGVRWLQKRGIILSPEAHHLHHSSYTHGYCVTHGWMNVVLDRVDFFGRAEQLIRTVIRRRRPENRGASETAEHPRTAGDSITAGDPRTVREPSHGWRSR